MTEEQYTTKRRKLKRRKFQHLAREKRAQIEILLKQGLAKTKIAKAVGISRSTINDFQKVLSSNLLRSNFLEFLKYLQYDLLIFFVLLFRPLQKPKKVSVFSFLSNSILTDFGKICVTFCL